PTFERPANAISARPSVGRSSILTTPLTNVHVPLNSASPRAISAVVKSAVAASTKATFGHSHCRVGEAKRAHRCAGVVGNDTRPLLTLRGYPLVPPLAPF